MADLIFFLGLALLFTHELDAIQHHEWRLFGFLKPLDDQSAYRLFTLAHLPLFIWFLWMAAHPAYWFHVLVDAFLIVHVALHVLFRTHPLYEFRGWFSHGLIVGAGLMGSIHLLLLVLT